MRWFVILIGLSACERGEVRAPEPTGIDPAVAEEGARVAVTIVGREFWVDPSVSFAGGGVEVNSTFDVRLGDVALLDVTYINGETLTATVPDTLVPGVYVLTVVDPRGHEGSLPGAFTVDESTVLVCERDEQCDDNDVCTGVETCVEHACVPGVDLDCDDIDPCTADSCDPATGCSNVPDVDQDNDGYIAASCSGDDCDDDPATCGAACNPGVGTDLCDGYNNDCDGSVDEDHVDTATTCGVGACVGNTGSLICSGGVETDTCDPVAGASADDDCDDVDDDCDGPADDDWVDQASTCGVGACAGNTGTITCGAGGATSDSCDPLAGASADDGCDDVDDDCDSTPDDDWVDQASTCGVGACAGNTGTITCGTGGVTSDSCDPFAGAGTEGPALDPTCSDGIDNDCDGPWDGADAGCSAAGNLPPLAVAGVAPPIGITGVTSFVASAAGTSDDADAPASLSYQWDWEDDGTFDDTGESANHTYPAAGTYTVVLLVTDSGGLVDYAVYVVVVADASDRILVTTELDEADGGATPGSPGGDGLSLYEAIQYANGLGGSPAIEVPSGMVIQLTRSQPSPVNVDIVGDGAAIDGQTQGACIVNPTDSVIAGFELYNCIVGVDVGSSSGNQLTRIFAHDTETGIETGSANLIGPDNELAGNLVGIVSNGSVEIWRNRVHDNNESGIDHRSGSAGTRIWQNVVWNNDYGVWLGTQSDWAEVVHNTIVSNINDGLFTSNNGTNLDVRNNILANNGGAGIVGADNRFAFLNYNAYFQNAGGTCSGCTLGANHSTDDPGFVNPSTNDYRLHPDSTLIDAGLDIGLDVNGRELLLFNGSAPDIGAYEAP